MHHEVNYSWNVSVVLELDVKQETTSRWRHSSLAGFLKFSLSWLIYQPHVLLTDQCFVYLMAESGVTAEQKLIWWQKLDLDLNIFDYWIKNSDLKLPNLTPTPLGPDICLSFLRWSLSQLPLIGLPASCVVLQGIGPVSVTRSVQIQHFSCRSVDAGLSFEYLYAKQQKVSSNWDKLLTQVPNKEQ